MKISIVTVSYDAASTIEDTLRSVGAQTYSEVEHIVVDGASRDGTREILERYRGRLAHLISEPDQGIYDAMNKGIQLATGDIVGTLNADDIYADSGVLECVAQAFQDPSVEACYGDLVYVAQDDPTRVRRYWKSREYRPGMFSRGWMPAHPTFFVRRSVYQRCGLFDTRYRLQSDFELTMRFLEICRIKSVYLPGIMVRMRMGGASNRNLRNVVRGNWEAYQACHAHGIKVSPLFFLVKTASRIPQFFARPPVEADKA